MALWCGKKLRNDNNNNNNINNNNNNNNFICYQNYNINVFINAEIKT